VLVTCSLPTGKITASGKWMARRKSSQPWLAMARRDISEITGLPPAPACARRVASLWIVLGIYS
jgi:hypothetical protein